MRGEGRRWRGDGSKITRVSASGGMSMSLLNFFQPWPGFAGRVDASRVRMRPWKGSGIAAVRSVSRVGALQWARRSERSGRSEDRPRSRLRVPAPAPVHALLHTPAPVSGAPEHGASRRRIGAVIDAGDGLEEGAGAAKASASCASSREYLLPAKSSAFSPGVHLPRSPPPDVPVLLQELRGAEADAGGRAAAPRGVRFSRRGHSCARVHGRPARPSTWHQRLAEGPDAGRHRAPPAAWPRAPASAPSRASGSGRASAVAPRAKPADGVQHGVQHGLQRGAPLRALPALSRARGEVDLRTRT